MGRIDLQFIAIPWHQLTELYLHNISPSPSQYLYILDRCEELTTARLDIFGMDIVGTHQLGKQNIALSQLQKLELDGNDLSTHAAFVNCLELPSLGDLSLLTADIHVENSIFPVTTFPAVRRLRTDAADHDPMLVPWLRACPSAVEVFLGYYEMLDSKLDEIANGSLLPNVELLTIDVREAFTTQPLPKLE
ncbi:hypothetical protein C8R44DRAFT_880890 [Mycena epipterygia]|nr:hypothetical protein C8R44DRAFT_880890 [Mycena epipterygia]